MTFPSDLPDLHVFDSLPAALAENFTGRRVARPHPDHPVGLLEVHAVNGVLSRLDGPAVTVYRVDGSVEEMQYYREGRKHRGGGLPARVHNGLVGIPGSADNEWWVNGLHHRLVGPALGYLWAIHGEYFTDRAEAFAAVRGAGLAGIRGALVGTEFEELLDRLSVNLPGAFDAIEAGVKTVAGVDEALGGTPAEWVAGFESGEALGFASR